MKRVVAGWQSMPALQAADAAALFMRPNLLRGADHVGGADRTMGAGQVLLPACRPHEYLGMVIWDVANRPDDEG